MAQPPSFDAAGSARCAGFVLAGGRSLRMGRDKALLEIGGVTLLERTAALVATVAGGITIIGAPERYGQFGLPVIPDKIEACGPLGGLYTALMTKQADWNLLVACDMPGLTRDFLHQLVDELRAPDNGCIVPRDSSGQLHPLCAIYHAGCLPVVEAHIESKSFSMHELLKHLQVREHLVADNLLLQNANYPSDWEQITHEPRREHTQESQ